MDNLAERTIATTKAAHAVFNGAISAPNRAKRDIGWRMTQLRDRWGECIERKLADGGTYDAIVNGDHIQAVTKAGEVLKLTIFVNGAKQLTCDTLEGWLASIKVRRFIEDSYL